MLAYKSFSCLLLIFKHHQSLLLPIHLKELGVDNGAMFLQVRHNLLLRDVLVKSGHMDHLCRGTAVAVILCSITVEAVKT